MKYEVMGTSRQDGVDGVAYSLPVTGDELCLRLTGFGRVSTLHAPDMYLARSAAGITVSGLRDGYVATVCFPVAGQPAYQAAFESWLAAQPEQLGCAR